MGNVYIGCRQVRNKNHAGTEEIDNSLSFKFRQIWGYTRIRNMPIKVPAAAQYRKKPKAGSTQIVVTPQTKVNKLVAIRGNTLLI